jgi:GH18 family chitinase
VCTETFQPKAAYLEVVGFYPAWKHAVLPVESIRWHALTRVIYAFAIAGSNGQLDVSSLTQVDRLVADAHSHGVGAYLSVGGGGQSGGFPVLAASPSARSRFVFNVVDYLGRHCLDGVDIDWESWTKNADNTPLSSEVDNLVLLLTDLRTELDKVGLQMSIDVFPSDWFGRHYADAVVDLVDHVYVMGYNFSGPWSDPGPHSSYDDTIGSGSSRSSTGLAYWREYRQWSVAKTYLGIPFYGRDFDAAGAPGIAYRSIVERYPDAPNSDRVANIYYDGVATVEAKTRYVLENGYPGVMIWEIAHDTDDPGSSLLSAIDRVANPSFAQVRVDRD